MKVGILLLWQFIINEGIFGWLNALINERIN